MLLHGTELKCEKPKRVQYHLFVTEQRSADAIVNDIFESLKKFLDDTLSSDNTAMKNIKPFITL